jgi:hypothetical protein
MTQTEPPTESIVSEDELIRQALAADPDAPIDDDASPLYEASPGGLLPLWYMPAPATTPTGSSRRLALAALIVVALLVVVSSGLCVCYGVVALG